MYTFVLAICLVYDIQGNPVNPCTMVEAPKLYSSNAQCMSEARKMKMEYFKVFSKEYPEASIVLHAPCGRSNRSGS